MRNLFHAEVEFFDSKLEWYSDGRGSGPNHRYLTFVNGDAVALREYDPFRDYPAMFKDFANTPQTETGILEFVHRYGMGAREIRYWSLNSWCRHINFLAHAEHLRIGLTKDHSKLVRMIVNEEFEPNLPFVSERVYRGIHSWDILASDGERLLGSVSPLRSSAKSVVRHLATTVLDTLVNGMFTLGNCVELFRSSDDEVHFRANVYTIECILWAQLAMAMSESAEFVQCQYCGRSIDLRVTRRDVKFCSDNCRVLKSMRRKRNAKST